MIDTTRLATWGLQLNHLVYLLYVLVLVHMTLSTAAEDSSLNLHQQCCGIHGVRICTEYLYLRMWRRAWSRRTPEAVTRL